MSFAHSLDLREKAALKAEDDAVKAVLKAVLKAGGLRAKVGLDLVLDLVDPGKVGLTVDANHAKVAPAAPAGSEAQA